MNSDPAVAFFTSLLVEPSGIDHAASLVRPEDFLLEDHRRAYRAMIDLAQSGKPIDSVHLIDKLMQRGMGLTSAGELVDRLLDGDAGDIHHYAALVRKASCRRRLIAAATAAITSAEAHHDPADIMCNLQVELWSLQSDRPESGPVALRDFVPEYLTQLTARRNQVGELAGLSTGIPELDDMTTGLRPGELWITGALPGRGKTAFGTQVATKAVSQGVPVLFFSIEMTRHELFTRMLGSQFGAWQMRTLHVSNKSFDAICARATEIAALPLYIHDPSSLTATELAAVARAAVRERGVKLIVVDYLQLLRGREREIRERVGNAADVLRQLAKDTQTPVLALSQLRRPANLNDRPTMIDLKESGDIEAHANTVLLLYQPKDDKPKKGEEEPSAKDEIIVGKQRNGPLRTVPVLFDPATLVFRPRTVAQYSDGGGRSWTGERDE